MFVLLTREISFEIKEKFQAISPYHLEIKEYFMDKFYGDDLTTIYMSIICESAGFAALIKPRKPSYKEEKEQYIYQGIQVERDGKSLGYDVIVNFDEYRKTEDIRPLLARDILNSLETIKTVKKYKILM